MATKKIRYLVTKRGRRLPDGGRASRHFWQPARALRGQGWHQVRLSDDEFKAIGEAEAWNNKLDNWYKTGERLVIPAAQALRGDSLKTLIADYKKSHYYTARAKKTRKGYDYLIGIIENWAGDAPVPAISYQRIETLYLEIRRTHPFKANALIVMLRILFKHGNRKPEIFGKDNPALLLTVEKIDRAARPLWTTQAVKQFAKAADELGWHSIGTAVIVNEWAGQREGDLIAMNRSALRDGVLWFKQSKRGRPMAIPIDMAPHLYQRLREEFARQQARTITATTLLVCDSTGRAWGEDYFRHVFADIRATANDPVFKIRQEHDPDAEVTMADLTFDLLRHTAVTRLAEAACEVPEIAGITGHSLKTVETILDTYLVRTAKLARNAFQKRLDAEEADNE